MVTNNILKKIKEILCEAEGIGDSQEFGLSYSQLRNYLDDIKAVVTKAEQNKPSPEKTKEDLSDLLAMCVIEETVCNSDGEAVTSFITNLFDERDMYDVVAGYLVDNGVGFVEKGVGE